MVFTNGYFWLVVLATVVVHWILPRRWRDFFLVTAFGLYISWIDWKAAMRSALLSAEEERWISVDGKQKVAAFAIKASVRDAALSSTAGAEMLERLEEWKQRARIEEGHVRMHLELRRAAEAERDRLAAELAETKNSRDYYASDSDIREEARATLEAKLALYAPIVALAREVVGPDAKRQLKALGELVDLCRAQAGGDRG